MKKLTIALSMSLLGLAACSDSNNSVSNGSTSKVSADSAPVKNMIF